jgi:hypothetical protein
MLAFVQNADKAATFSISSPPAPATMLLNPNAVACYGKEAFACSHNPIIKASMGFHALEFKVTIFSSATYALLTITCLTSS